MDIAKKKLVQTALQIASRVAPPLAAQLTWRLFCTPMVASSPTPSQAEILSRATTFKIPFGRRNLRCYQWGSEGPTVLAVHGWGGRAHVFGDLVPSLLQRGFRVVTFDAPGHRRLGQRTNMMEYSSAIRTVAREVGKVDALLGHSFGAFTSAYTADRLPDLKAICLIGAPDRLEFMLDYAQKEMAAPSHIMKKVEQRIEKLSGDPVKAHATAQYLQKVDIPKLIVHDHDDRDVPVERALRLAGDIEAELFLTQGFGHHRILSSEVVGERLAEFFAEQIKPVSCSV